jgi:hypothetical protein
MSGRRIARSSKQIFPRTGKKPKTKKESSSSTSSGSKARKKSQKAFQLSALGVSKLRLFLSGGLKPTQVTQRGKNVLDKNPKLVRDFLSILTTVKIRGNARKNGINVSIFDPHDESKFHSGLFKLVVKGKNFLVKEVQSQAFPYNPHSQFVLHQKLQTINPHLKKFNCEVCPYIFAWEGKSTSFLVSPFLNGITLEKWVSENPKREKSNTYRRFIKARRILNDSLGIKDVTTRNVIYNPKTDKLSFFDLMPPN